jgi:CRP/FNR family transcriptional regulator, cyclic AMP receptor protein
MPVQSGTVWRGGIGYRGEMLAKNLTLSDLRRTPGSGVGVVCLTPASRAAPSHGQGTDARKRRDSARKLLPFNLPAFLDSAGVPTTVVKYGRGEAIFAQGEACAHVMYIQAGGVKLSVLSKAGREAIVATLGPGAFFGEGCLAGQSSRMRSATALTASVIVLVEKRKMVQLLHRQHAMSDRFISHMLSRNLRIEEDLIDQLFNSSEKRLARTLLRLAGYGTQHPPARTVPRISPKTLAGRIGSTRARVLGLLHKFKKLGFIDDDGETPLTINSSLLTVVLHD